MNFLHLLNAKLAKADGLGLLFLRIWLGQEFFLAGYIKLGYGFRAPDWFVSLDFPFPLYLLSANLNWIFAGFSEIIFSALLILGIFTRFSAIALLYITWVAVYSVHFDLGWTGWNQIDTDLGQGFKVPLMIALMLVVLVIQGSGRFALLKIFDMKRITLTDSDAKTF